MAAYLATIAKCQWPRDVIFEPDTTVSVVGGEVTAVSGISVPVLSQAKASVSITVPTTVTVSQSSVANIAALQVGQCLRANGSRDTAGNVQATAFDDHASGAVRNVLNRARIWRPPARRRTSNPRRLMLASPR